MAARIVKLKPGEHPAICDSCDAMFTYQVTDVVHHVHAKGFQPAEGDYVACPRCAYWNVPKHMR